MKYVVGFSFNEDMSRVLLMLKNRPEWQEGKYNGVGGKIDGDETPIEAMVREFREETGVATLPEDWYELALLHGTDHAGDKFEVHCFSTEKILAFYNATSMTDELLFRAAVSTPALFPERYVPSVPWLIWLARDKNMRDRRMRVQAHYEY